MMDHTFISLRAVSVFASVLFFAAYASGQSSPPPPNGPTQEVAIVPSSKAANSNTALANSEKKPADQDKSIAATSNNTPADVKNDDVKEQLAAMKAENAEVREQLRRMAEGQMILIEQLDRLRRRLDRAAPSDRPSTGDPAGTAPAPGSPNVGAASGAPDDTQLKGDDGGAAPDSATASAKQDGNERYRDGIVIWKTPDDASVPFLLKFNNDTQIRYLNTMSADDTFTDHLGVVREVNRRNDITVNRSMFNINGYIFSPRLGYSLKVWTSAGAASIVVAGNISWTFNKALTVVGGYTGLPGSRSLVATFPFFQAIDRSMADNFFRPGFTQGLWAFGEPIKGLNYQVMVGNGLNTLGVSANKIDTGLALAGTVWWEPLGPYGEPGKSRNMYDDYFSSDDLRIRVGTSFTRSREDRFSNLDVSTPENTALHNSDGVLTFSTGAFAPGVTLQRALYKMWAIDGGLKYSGLAINGQYFMRWLSDFEADGPIPLTSTYDHGFELTAGHFVIPKKLQIYGRGSAVFGEFRNSSEYGAGVRWYFLPTERLWLNAELMRINHAPYGGAFTPYTAGLNGWAPMVQTVLAF